MSVTGHSNSPEERRHTLGPDRRRFSRGGRRTSDLPGRHPRVIIADSYEAARRPCIRYLDHFSFDVAPAPDGESAIEAIGTQTTAVILMDSHLKDPSSRRRLASESQTRGIPLILLVDTQSEARDPDMSDLQPAAVLVKPFPLAVMIDTISGVLRARSGLLRNWTSSTMYRTTTHRQR